MVGPDAARRFAGFFAGHSYAHQVVNCPEYGDDDRGRWERFLRALAGGGYDCCVIDPDSRGLLAEQAAACRIPVRIGFASGAPDDRFLTRTIKLPRSIFGLPDLVDFARGLAGVLGLPPPRPAEVVPPFRYRPRPVPDLPGPVVAVHPGGAPHWNRRWPLACYAEPCRLLAGSHRASFVPGRDEVRDLELVRLRRAQRRPGPGPGPWRLTRLPASPPLMA